jgi:uncharacterized SAM-binding protein YcdF (DUF218 family)
LVAGLSAVNVSAVSAPSALAIVRALSAVSMLPAALAGIGLASSAQVASAGVRIVPPAIALALIAPTLIAGGLIAPLRGALDRIAPVLSAVGVIFAPVLRGLAAAAVARSAARGAPRARAALEHAPLRSRNAALSAAR